MICWTPVDVNQCGGPEVVVAYVLAYWALRAAGLPPEGLYTQQVLAEIPAPAYQCVAQPVPDPQLGEALLVQVDAVDGVGNSSRDHTVCP